MGPHNRAPAMDLLKDPANRRVFPCRRVGGAMNPRQVRRDEFQERFAPQLIVESGAGDRLVDGDDDLEPFVVLMFRQRRVLMSESSGHGRDPPSDDLRSGRVEIGAAALGERDDGPGDFSPW